MAKRVAGAPILIESSLELPEGLRITCKDVEHAHRLHEFLKLVTPPRAHYLYEQHDRALLLRYPPKLP